MKVSTNNVTSLVPPLQLSPGRSLINSASALDGVTFIQHRIVGISRWAIAAPTTLATHGAHSDPVLLIGEAGAGKKHAAKLIHEVSDRADRPFVVVACDSIPEEAINALLFGPTETMSSRAYALWKDCVHRARGGTLYVEDASLLSIEMRARVARLIHNRDGVPAELGPIAEPEIRLIFGASDSQGLVTHPYDLSGCVVKIPALRDRADDIELLCEFFVTESCRKLGKESRVLSNEVLGQLRRYSWPGNVSELKRVVEYMVRHSEPPALDTSLLPVHIGAEAPKPVSSLPENGISLQDQLREYEKALLHAALEQCHGVQTKAAQLLGMKMSTLNTKILHYGIDAASFKPKRKQLA